MKKTIAGLLCIVLLVTCVSVVACADSGYSTISNKNVALEYPEASSRYAVPQLATIKASKPNGSIYLMPTPQDGNGVLGTVANGTQVTVLAEKSGYYFFQTADGRAGWNGGKFLEFIGPATAQGQGNTFTFDGGASLVLPAGFYSTNVERDQNNARASYEYINYDQDMDLTLTEISTYMYYQRDTDFLNSLYSSYKGDYPNPTYDSKKSDRFDMSGYTGNYIYYFEGILSNQVIYLIEMFYPTRNRAVCDKYVEDITGSFREAGTAVINWGTPSGSASTLNIPQNPQSPYGVALRDNLIYGTAYSDMQKKDVVNETYYGRKDEKGERQPWYTSSSYDDPNTGYRIGFYYADGLVFFADAYHIGERSAVTFYFWGDQLLCVHDLRNGDKQLHFAGSDTYNAIVREFGNLYAQAVAHAR